MELDGVGKPARILMLLSDAFGGFGGIAQYNRDVIHALAELDAVGAIVALPRLVPEAVGPLPAKLDFETGAARSSFAFIWQALRHGLFGPKPDMILCAHVNLAAIAWLCARLRGVPFALLVFGIDVWQAPPSRLAAWATRRSDFIYSISRVTLDRMRSWCPVDDARTAILPNAIQLSDFGVGERPADLIQKYDLVGRKVLMTFGRLHSKERAKGFDEMLNILPRLVRHDPAITYVIAGTGDDRERLERKVADLGMGGHVRFTGRVEEARKADHYRLADLYVMPSRGEGFGFVIIEALACGVPVVASSMDGGREAVLDGALGPIVDPDDPDALYDAVIAGLDAPHGVPAGLSHFDWPNFRARMGAAIADVLALR